MVYIVYGGAGYIGSHLTTQLLKAGKRVICIDNLINSYSSIFDGIENQENLSLFTEDEFKFTEMERVEAIFHFASLKSVPESIIKPTEYYENNIGATCRALELMDDTGCDTFIFSGSASVYGLNSPVGGSKETDPLFPNNPYARTKVACENLINDFANLNPEKRFISLRYFNPYGGVEVPKKKDYLNFLPGLYTAIKTSRPFKIYGNDYQTPDRSCIRDFIHISDLIKGHLSCLSYKPFGFHIFNLGSGKPLSILQVVNMFKSKYPALKVEVCPRRSGDAITLFANIEKARNELGWSPQVEMTPRIL